MAAARLTSGIHSEMCPYKTQDCYSAQIRTLMQSITVQTELTCARAPAQALDVNTDASVC